MTTVRLDGAAMAKLLRSKDGPVARDMIRRATRVQEAARRQVGKKTHQLEHSILKRFVSDSHGFAIQVGSTQPYALVHHEGSRPHVIYPRRAKVLVFSVGGQTVFASKVNHPGFRGNKYLTDSLKYAR